MRRFDAAPAVPYRNLPQRPPSGGYFGGPPATRQNPNDTFAGSYDDAKEAELFCEIASLTAGAPLEHYFSNLHRALSKIMRAPIMVVAVKDVAASGGFKWRYRRDASHADVDPVIEQRFIDPAVLGGKPVLFQQMPKVPTGGFLQQAADSVGSLMVAPLSLENQVIGFLAVRNPSDGVFDDRDLERFARVANVAALVVRNEITTAEAAARRAELGLMLETARMLAAERDLSKFFEAFHGIVAGVMDAESFFVGLGTWNDGGSIGLRYCVHHHRKLDAVEPLPLKGTVAGHVFREGMPLILRSKLDFRSYTVIEQGTRDEIQSGIVMPLQNGHRVIGVICAQSSKPNAYSVRERDLLEVLGELCAIAIETSRAGASPSLVIAEARTA